MYSGPDGTAFGPHNGARAETLPVPMRGVRALAALGVQNSTPSDPPC